MQLSARPLGGGSQVISNANATPTLRYAAAILGSGAATYQAYSALVSHQIEAPIALVALQAFIAFVELVASWRFARGPIAYSDSFFIGFFAINAVLDLDALYTLSSGELRMLTGLLASHWGLHLLTPAALAVGVAAKLRSSATRKAPAS